MSQGAACPARRTDARGAVVFLVKLLAVGHWLTLLAGCFAKRSGCVAYKAFASVTSGYMGGGNRVQSVQTVQNVQIAHIMPHEQRN